MGTGNLRESANRAQAPLPAPETTAPRMETTPPNDGQQTRRAYILREKNEMTICRLSWGCASIQWGFLKLGTSILYGIPAAHGSAVLLLNTNPSLKSLVMICRPRGRYRTGTPPCGHTRVVQLLMMCISSIRLDCHLCLPYNSRACLKASVLVFRPKFGDFRFDDSVFEPVQIYFQRELESNHCPPF